MFACRAEGAQLAPPGYNLAVFAAQPLRPPERLNWAGKGTLFRELSGRVAAERKQAEGQTFLAFAVSGFRWGKGILGVIVCLL